MSRPRRESGKAVLGHEARFLTAEIGGESLRVATRSGYPEWWQVDPAQALLGAYAELVSGQRTLVTPCGHGALAAWASRAAGAAHVHALDTNAVAVEMARRTLDANGMEGTRVAVGPPAEGSGLYDVVLMPVPKGRELSRLYLLAAFRALSPGGRLYLAGANRGGVKSIISDAEALFGPALVLGYRAGHRVALLTRPSNDPSALPEIFAQPGVAAGTYRELLVTAGDHDYGLGTRPGVFSWKRLDLGTELLLSVLAVRATDRVLDLGCGYGIIGLHAARAATAGSVEMVDVDALACECAERNRLVAGATNAQVRLGDGRLRSSEDKLTLIVTNPPFHQGREQSLETTQAFIGLAGRALARGGRFVVVANGFLPYERAMGEAFGAVDVLARTPQYQVLSATRQRRLGSEWNGPGLAPQSG